MKSVNWQRTALCSLLGQDMEEDSKNWYCSRQSRTALANRLRHQRNHAGRKVHGLSVN